MRTFILVILVSFISGCTYLGKEIKVQYIGVETPEATKIIETTTSSAKYKYHIVTNYKLKEAKTSNIGSAMIKVEDLAVKNTVIDVVTETISNDSQELNRQIRAKEGFEVLSPFQIRKSFIKKDIKNISFNANDVFTITDMFRMKDVLYYIISNNKTIYQFLITEDGLFVVDKYIHDYNYLFDDKQMKILPNGIKFDMNEFNASKKVLQQRKIENAQQKEIQTTVQPKAPINYELIYGGKDLTGLHVVYREYTNDGIARQAFYQNLNYENNAKTIQFKNLNIEIVKADNKQITFKVLEDDVAAVEQAVNREYPENEVTKNVIIK